MGVRQRVGALSAIAILFVTGCDSDSEDGDTTVQDATSSATATVEAPEFVDDVRRAVDAVEAELGGPQKFFEVTSNAQFTNVFVAVDDASAAVPYVYLDGQLHPPAPRQDGASGDTFTAADIDFDQRRVLTGVADELPTTSIDAISVYGAGAGATYVLAGTSQAGGFLDIVVGPDGTILSVDPV